MRRHTSAFATYKHTRTNQTPGTCMTATKKDENDLHVMALLESALTNVVEADKGGPEVEAIQT
jgi:hypothetical protein